MEETGTATIVCYHYPCHDGAFAALAAHLHFAGTQQAVRFVPNRVYAPCTVTDLQLQVHLKALVVLLKDLYAVSIEQLFLGW